MAIAARDQFDQALLNRVNQARRQAGLAPVLLSQKIDTAADQFSRRMAVGDFFDLTDPGSGETILDQVKDTSYRPSQIWALLAGVSNAADQVFSRWMGSQQGRDSILAPRAQHLGVGYYFLKSDPGQVQFQHYWTLVLAVGDPNPGVYRPDGEDPPSSIILGTPRPDTLLGDAAANTLRGLAGNDVLRGGIGPDKLWGDGGQDRLFGDSGADILVGGRGNDVLKGGGGPDVLMGVQPSASQPWVGQGEIDQLTGNAGPDLFQLGDRNGAYYQDGQVKTLGVTDYALILDFNAQAGDRIQLHGQPDDYLLGSSTGGLPSGTAIYYLSSQGKELIGVLSQIPPTNLGNNAFSFVI
ncbi:CAP domain-containing protein [Lyngbya confervoides]|uniref:CAP domain-containing protein n=1 Tax=Lyngbya confervoides TaxID=207921 RepID=UPI002546DB57|nr:CAP domain-containing protein [Lyngbya confervoides]